MLTLLALQAWAAPTPLDAFFTRSERAGSTALFVERDGHVLVDWHRGSDKPARAMSMTKSVVGLLVAMLHDDGRIASFDLPLSTWYPEADPVLGGTPLRAVLEMTTGLEPCAELSDCDDGGDAVGYALRSPRRTPVGVWAYNNNAVNLLSGVVARVTGAPMDVYAASALFAPLGITDARWERDAQGAAYAAAGLWLSAHDLARIGELLLGGGQWNGRTIVSADGIDALTRPAPAHPWYGRLWFPVYPLRPGLSRAILDYGAARGVDPAIVDALRPLAGRFFGDEEAVERAAVEALGGGPVGGDRWRTWAFSTWGFDVDPDAVGYAAEGYCGQYLVVIPSLHVVAVRQRRIGRVYQEYEDDRHDLSQWPEHLAAAFFAE